MRSLRALTALFVLLLLLPGAILAWLGWQSTATFAAQAQAVALATARDVAAEFAAQVPEREAASEQRIRADLERIAENLAAKLPFQSIAKSLAEAATTIDLPGQALLFLRYADGSMWLPSSAQQLAPKLTRAQIEAARLEANGEFSAAVDCLLAVETGTNTELYARQLALAASTAQRQALGAARELSEGLARVPTAAILSAAPLSLTVLLEVQSAELHFTAAARSRALDAIPAPVDIRARWYARSKDAAEFAAEQSLRQLYAREPAKFVTLRTALPADCSLDLAISHASWLTLLTPLRTIRSCRLNLTGTENNRSGDDEADGRIRGSLRLRTGLASFSVTNPAFVAIASNNSRQRVFTAIGIALLLAVMGTGVLLVRRSIASERSARRLRDDFIANISHELKTPLTSIRMHTEMLSEGEIDDATRSRYGAVVEAEGARLSSLVEDLLDFSALERGQRRIEPSPVSLIDAAEACALAWQPLAREAEVKLTVESERASILGMADTTALSRILTNLLQNAWRHGRTPREGEQSIIRIVVLATPAIEVRDNGKGIPEADRGRIFERFQRGTLTDSTDGSGIGLALSRELAEAIGGKLAVLDDGQETIFRLTLPAVPAEVPPHAP